MSNDSQIPTDNQNNSPEIRRDNIETDLWDLDDEPVSSFTVNDQISNPSPPAIDSKIETVTPAETRATDTRESFPNKEELSNETLENLLAENPPTEDEFPAYQPINLKTYYSTLTTFEKISIVAVIVVIALGATFSIIHFSTTLPIKPFIADELDMPIKGKLVTVNSMETYWRKPKTTGENADIVRRDVVLIPCIRLKLNGSSAAIRVFFRDEQKALIGDNISQSVSGSTNLELSATDGFKDLGLHAAYRAGDSGNWTIQVLEGPSRDAPMEEFKTLFETDISPNIR